MTNLHRSGLPTGFNGGPILLQRIYKSLPIDWNGEKRKYHVMRSDTRSLFGQSIHVIRSEEEVLLNGPLWLTATAHILGGGNKIRFVQESRTSVWTPQIRNVHGESIRFSPLLKSGAQEAFVVGKRDSEFGLTLMFKFRRVATERRWKRQLVP